MTTDPKKNDEIKDEELDKVSGGTGEDSFDERPDPDAPGPKTGQGGIQRI